MRRIGPILLRILLLAAVLYAFFLGLDLMGLAFKLFGKGFAEALVERTSSPFVGLFIGILATSLVQSSSTTTSMVVGLVAAGALNIQNAVPIIMGANIGTSVTNTLVSLGHVTRREEFRRAFAGATIHDFFNILSVAILLPLEAAFGILSRSAAVLEEAFGDVGGRQLLNPLKEIVRPVADWSAAMLGESGIWTLVLGVALIIVALRYLVKLLRVMLSGPAEQMLHRTLFRSPLAAIAAGTVITAMVQSSSVTTSVMVPLVGAGVITLEQLFPFTVGANIGTTVTAILAALSTGDPSAIAVSFTHLLFNIAGTLIVYASPLRRLPLYLARRLGELAAKNRILAGVYIGVVFYGIPLLLLLLSGTLLGRTPADARLAPPAVQERVVESPKPLPYRVRSDRVRSDRVIMAVGLHTTTRGGRSRAAPPPTSVES